MSGCWSAWNGTTLHQSPQIPGSGDFLPNFLPKQAARWRWRGCISWSQPITGVPGQGASPASQADSVGSIPVTRSKGLIPGQSRFGRSALRLPGEPLLISRAISLRGLGPGRPILVLVVFALLALEVGVDGVGGGLWAGQDAVTAPVEGPMLVTRTRASRCPVSWAAGSHAGTHAGKRPSSSSDSREQRAAARPRSRTVLNESGRPCGYLRIKRS